MTTSSVQSATLRHWYVYTPEQHVVSCDSRLARADAHWLFSFLTLLLDGVRCLTAYSSSNVNGGTVALVKLYDDIVPSFGMRADEDVVLASVVGPL